MTPKDLNCIKMKFNRQINVYECIMNIPEFRIEGNNEGFGK